MTEATARNPAVLRWLFAIQLVSMGALEMSAPFWGLQLRDMGGLSGTALAWASAIAYAGPMATAMLCTPWWGRLGDKLGHKTMVLRALLALTLTQLWIAHAGDVLTLLGVRLLQGALAGFIAAAQAYAAVWTRQQERSALMARLQIATALGSLLGPMLGGWVYDLAGFSMLNTTAAVLCGVCTVVAYGVLPRTAKRAPTGQAEQVGLFPPVSGIQALLLGVVLVQSAKMLPQTFFGLYAQQVLEAPAWLTGLCYGATAVGLCIGAPLWAKRFARQAPGEVLRQLEWICWGCAVVVALQASSHDFTLVVLSRVVWGVGLGALLPVFYSLLSQQVSTDQQGWVLGMGNSAAKAGALLGAAAGGAVLAWMPLSAAFWPVVAMYGVAAVGVRAIRRHQLRA
nr:MFS transporter [uncultured Rhodoferax sp.]